jgi:RNA polymerase sigma factor (TIGR02999 family)
VPPNFITIQDAAWVSGMANTRVNAGETPTIPEFRRGAAWVEEVPGNCPRRTRAGCFGARKLAPEWHCYDRADGESMNASGPITELLRRRASGDSSADERLVPLIYEELRSIAARQLAHERGSHTLTPTALVHEAYLRLSDSAQFAPNDRRHFFAIAATRMRQVLVDHARRRAADKRGGGVEALTLSTFDGAEPGTAAASVDALALDQALARLGEADPRKAQVVELRYFAGLEMQEIADLLSISRATAQRDWDLARAFLHRVLA